MGLGTHVWKEWPLFHLSSMLPSGYMYMYIPTFTHTSISKKIVQSDSMLSSGYPPCSNRYPRVQALLKMVRACSSNCLNCWGRFFRFGGVLFLAPIARASPCGFCITPPGPSVFHLIFVCILCAPVACMRFRTSGRSGCTVGFYLVGAVSLGSHMQTRFDVETGCLSECVLTRLPDPAQA